MKNEKAMIMDAKTDIYIYDMILIFFKNFYYF